VEPRFLGGLARVDTGMTSLNDTVLRILDGKHLSVLATASPSGRPQTSVIFVTRDGDDILFSTIKGRRKTINMVANPQVNLLVQSLEEDTYATISGTVTMVDDPDGSFHQAMYDLFMDGAPTPPEPGAERVTVRLTPARVFVQPEYQPAE
jgi:PPOX class probable F420-dependent enzyme